MPWPRNSICTHCCPPCSIDVQLDCPDAPGLCHVAPQLLPRLLFTTIGHSRPPCNADLQMANIDISAHVPDVWQAMELAL